MQFKVSNSLHGAFSGGFCGNPFPLVEREMQRYSSGHRGGLYNGGFHRIFFIRGRLCLPLAQTQGQGKDYPFFS